jgi:hypothetical protein
LSKYLEFKETGVEIRNENAQAPQKPSAEARCLRKVDADQEQHDVTASYAGFTAVFPSPSFAGGDETLVKDLVRKLADTGS